jgi:hypothetical protein
MPGTPDTAAYPWCVLGDVVSITGVAVDQQTLNLARDAIELATGAIENVARQYLSRRDYYWLRQGVAYQAVWLAAQPDYLTRDDVANFSQDGAMIIGATPDRIRLAPLARSACRRLSWKGTRSIAPRVPLSARGVDFEGNPLSGNNVPLPQYIGGNPFLDGSDFAQNFVQL